MKLRSIAFAAAAVQLLACSSTTQQSDADAPGGDTAAFGSEAAARCQLPAAGSSGIPAPSGTADGVVVLDWAGFAAAVSYTFDDANSSQIDHYAEIQALGVPMTFYLQTGKSTAASETWAQALLDGHELGNHTQSHRQEGTGEDVDAATAFIQEHYGVTPYTMAAPYGNTSYVSLAETRFLINRGVGGGRISPNGSSNPFDLPCHIPAEGASAEDLNGVIDTTQSAGSWQILLVHGFTGGSDGAYQPIDFAAFVANVDHTKSLGDVWIDTVVRVGAYWRAQKLFSELTPTSSGSETTWTWSLPDHFPPSMCLRVTTGGGTLSQNDEALTWDEHGYYHVALDAGSLTLAP